MENKKYEIKYLSTFIYYNQRNFEELLWHQYLGRNIRSWKIVKKIKKDLLFEMCCNIIVTET